MAFKLIATDLDGTLLRSDGSISTYTIETLQKATEQGVEFVISTGRMLSSLKTILPLLPFCRWCITCNGAEIYERNGKLHYLNPMPNESAREILVYAREHHLHAQLYHDNNLFVKEYNQYLALYESRNPIKGIPVGMPLEDYLGDKTPAKIIFILEPRERDKHLLACRQRFGDKLSVVSSDPMYVECMVKGCSKDVALLELERRLGISKEEALVFGDSGNDVSMLKNAGFSCCVANGWPEAQKASNLLIESNDHDGVARTVERLVLKQLYGYGGNAHG